MMGILGSELRLHVIRPTLKYLNLESEAPKIILWSEAAENLFMGTAAHESQMERYLTQLQGVALSIYQIEPATHKDICQRYLLRYPALALKVKSLASERSAWTDKNSELITNLAYATAIARGIYYRSKEPLPHPNDIEGLAKYWKQHYNTPNGKREVADFIYHYKKLAL